VEAVVAAVAQAVARVAEAALAAVGARCLQLLAQNFPLQPKPVGLNAVVVVVAEEAVAER
jgi:hypothetical protein